MNKKIKKNQSGFTLIEILIAVTVFAIGILGVAIMQLSAIKGNSYASHLSEASTITQNKIEELILLNYDNHVLFDDDGDGVEDDDNDGVNDGNGTNQDTDGNGVDDDDEGTYVDGVKDFGLNHTNKNKNKPGETPDETNQSNGVTGVQYTTFCNIAVNQPIQNTKTISIITTWTEKGAPKKVTMNYIKFDEI
ncbi:MAG: prepilin-type N-terminal cleavage/methylation domain-containing protein [Clostridiales bacterium]|nr:prepilin-type N-terminal cleavage/methylation domain-containing protein [Clostridiales bacterium]